MDNSLVHSPMPEQQQFVEMLEIFRHRQLFAKSSKCEFGLQELGFLGQSQKRAHQ